MVLGSRRGLFNVGGLETDSCSFPTSVYGESECLFYRWFLLLLDSCLPLVFQRLMADSFPGQCSSLWRVGDLKGEINGSQIYLQIAMVILPGHGAHVCNPSIRGGGKRIGSSNPSLAILGYIVSSRPTWVT